MRIEIHDNDLMLASETIEETLLIARIFMIMKLPILGNKIFIKIGKED